MRVARILFRIFNLIVYAAYFSILGVFYMSDSLYHYLYGWLGPTTPTARGYLLLAAFLIGNMVYILIFRLLSNRKNIEWMYYLCDATIRVTFTIPVCFVIYYYLIIRFFPIINNIPVSIAVLAVLFLVWDYMMRWQIRFQLHANYYSTNNHL